MVTLILMKYKSKTNDYDLLVIGITIGHHIQFHYDYEY